MLANILGCFPKEDNESFIQINHDINQFKFAKNNAAETANVRNFSNFVVFLLVKQLTNEKTIASNGKKTCKIEIVLPRKVGK